MDIHTQSTLRLENCKMISTGEIGVHMGNAFYVYPSTSPMRPFAFAPRTQTCERNLEESPKTARRLEMKVTILFARPTVKSTCLLTPSNTSKVQKCISLLVRGQFRSTVVHKDRDCQLFHIFSLITISSSLPSTLVSNLLSSFSFFRTGY